MPRSGNDRLGVSIPNLQKGRDLPLKGLLPGEVIADLNINFLAPPLRNEIDLFLIELSDINLVAPAKQLHADHVFIEPPVIQIPVSEDSVAKPAVAEIEFFGIFQIFFSANIIALDVIENKGAAQIFDFDIFPDGDVIRRNAVCRQKPTDPVRRGQIADVIHQEFTQMLQDRCIRQSVFLNEVPGDDRPIDLFKIVDPILLGSISVRTGQPALAGIILEEPVTILRFAVVLAVFPETERENMDLDITTREQGCQIRT